MLRPLLHLYEPLTLSTPQRVLSETMADAGTGSDLGNALDALRTIPLRLVCNDTQHSHSARRELD